MNRSEKKTDNAIVKALNDICETLKEESKGFVWLTHFVDYAKFPQSLKIVFVFDSDQNLINAKNDALFKTIFDLCEARLKRESIHIKRIDKAVFFDTEENGADFENIKWCRKYS